MCAAPPGVRLVWRPLSGMHTAESFDVRELLASESAPRFVKVHPRDLKRALAARPKPEGSDG